MTRALLLAIAVGAIGEIACRGSSSPTQPSPPAPTHGPVVIHNTLNPPESRAATNLFMSFFYVNQFGNPLLAAHLSARRAPRVDPIAALRIE
jgi:hypothetical protein